MEELLKKVLIELELLNEKTYKDNQELIELRRIKMLNPEEKEKELKKQNIISKTEVLRDLANQLNIGFKFDDKVWDAKEYNYIKVKFNNNGMSCFLMEENIIQDDGWLNIPLNKQNIRGLITNYLNSYQWVKDYIRSAQLVKTGKGYRF